VLRADMGWRADRKDKILILASDFDSFSSFFLEVTFFFRSNTTISKH
jgi:hypothetical protein